MVKLRVFETSQTGKVVVPYHFPIGVFASRFGLVTIVKTPIKHMTKVSRYLDFDRGSEPHFTVRELSEVDRSSRLDDFYFSIKEVFDASNEFTYEYTIDARDISVAEGYKKYNPNRNKTVEVSEGVSEPVEVAPVKSVVAQISLELVPLDMYKAGKVATSSDESVLLKESINYYLHRLGLKLLDVESSRYPIHYLSTKGDAMLKVALLDYFSNRKVLDLLSSNASMQLALGRLEFYDFLEVDTHLAGTFFEVLYMCSVLQGNDAVRLLMEKTLVGEQSMTDKLPELKFKE